MPEFFDIDVTKCLLETIGEFEFFHNLIAHVANPDDVHILMEDELGPKLRGSYGFVFTRFETPQHTEGEIGVIGPTRLRYTQIVPTVRYFGGLIEEIAQGW